MVVGVGGMAAASTMYPEYLVLDSDLLHDFSLTAAGIEVNSDTLALDVVRKVGPRGNYLMEAHTIEHLRSIPYSNLILETTKRGRTGATAEIETAREQARWIIENHNPDPLDGNAQRELARIVAAADRELRGG
jgi:trimethylamine--corrinoid protein Co-methyltransferase